jgi:GNAT superfamily N-acetyltransferase
MVPAWTIVRLKPEDAIAYRAVRLEALRLHPSAFVGSFEEETARPLLDTVHALERYMMFGAKTDAGMLLAIGGAFVIPPTNVRHKAMLFGMYVRPMTRNAGIGGALLDRIIEEASTVAEKLLATIAASNEGARLLYLSRGFEEYGYERHALKVGEDYIDERLMARFLT